MLGVVEGESDERPGALKDHYIPFKCVDSQCVPLEVDQAAFRTPPQLVSATRCPPVRTTCHDVDGPLLWS